MYNVSVCAIEYGTSFIVISYLKCWSCNIVVTNASLDTSNRNSLVICLPKFLNVRIFPSNVPDPIVFLFVSISLSIVNTDNSTTMYWFIGFYATHHYHYHNNNDSIHKTAAISCTPSSDDELCR
jgi:hypothetical protein